jgi:hypothetical protein
MIGLRCVHGGVNGVSKGVHERGLAFHEPSTSPGQGVHATRGRERRF